MPKGYYGVYFQGAVFYKGDFDPVKVIQAAAKYIRGISFPERIASVLEQGTFDRDIALEICDLLDIAVSDRGSVEDYSYISDIFLRDSDDWFEAPDPIMGSPRLGVEVFNDVAGEFRYFDKSIGSDTISECFMFALPCPLVWEIGIYEGPRTKEEVICLIRDTAKPLLKDDIDWDSRLGDLIGSSEE